MLGEQLLMSLKVMVLGLGTVFIALIALIYVIEIINKVLNSRTNVGTKKNKHLATEYDEELTALCADAISDVLGEK